MGYHRAGFDVTGVDQAPQPRYPFRFWQADALSLEPSALAAFDAIHASPPCQAYSALRTGWKDGRTWPDLVAPTRALLERAGRPWVIENVPGAPLRASVMLCGTAVQLPPVLCSDGRLRQVQRHRLFETSWPLSALVPPCLHAVPALGVYGRGRWSPSSPGHSGAYQGSKDENAAGMGISWLTRDGLAEAIPPAYTELIGRWLLEAATS